MNKFLKTFGLIEHEILDNVCYVVDDYSKFKNFKFDYEVVWYLEDDIPHIIETDISKKELIRYSRKIKMQKIKQNKL